MRDALEQLKASVDKEDAFRAYDAAFHHALAEASHNRLMILVNDAVMEMSSKITDASIASYSPAQRAELNRRIFETHNAIFQAVVARDAAEACRCAEAVVNLFREQSPPEGELPQHL